MRLKEEVIEFLNQMPKEIKDKTGWDSGAKSVLEWILEEPFTDINGNSPMCTRCTQKMEILCGENTGKLLFKCNNCGFKSW